MSRVMACDQQTDELINTARQVCDTASGDSQYGLAVLLRVALPRCREVLDMAVATGRLHRARQPGSGWRFFTHAGDARAFEAEASAAAGDGDETELDDQIANGQFAMATPRQGSAMQGLAAADRMGAMRAGAEDFRQYPSRFGDVLRWRDGRVTNLQGQAVAGGAA